MALIISNGDRCLDRGVRVVALEREVLVAEIFQLGHRGIEEHAWKRTRFTRKLLARLLKVVHVEMEVSESVDELLGLQSTDLSDHHREQGVGGDVKGDAEEEIRAALVELAAEFAIRDIELDQGVARGQRHLVDLSGVPGADDVTAAVGILFQILDDARDLVDGATLGGAPPAPLRSVDGAEIAVRIGPLVPDRDAVLLEVADVGVPLEEPEQLVDDGAEVELLGGEQRKALPQVKALLRTKDRERSRAGAIFFPGPLIEDQAEETVIRKHGIRWVSGRPPEGPDQPL